jgi:hypothetical protein
MIQVTLTGMRAIAVILAIQGTAMADTIYRWTSSDGQLHFSDTPPTGRSTFTRGSVSGNQASAGRQGLRDGERRMLEQQATEMAKNQRSRQSQSLKAHQRRALQQQTCRETRERLRNTRDHTLRKQYAGELRQRCW